jgi:hypothetical protein
MQAWITDLLSFKSAIYDFQTNGESFIQAMLETPLGQMNSFLWSQDGTCEMLNLYKEKFNLVKGLTIYKRHSNYIEGWCFSGGPEAYIPLTINFFTLKPFEEFIKYFALSAGELLKKNPPTVGFESPISLAYKINPNYKLSHNLYNAIPVEPLLVPKPGLQYKPRVIKSFINHTLH